MDSPLIQSLINWTQVITSSQFPQHPSSSDFVDAFRYLLLQIDPDFFQSLNESSAKASQIIALISDYNKNTLNTPLSPNSLPLKPQSLTPSKVSQIFQLIFSIAFRIDSSRYVSEILNLKQSDQQILMSFVDTLVKQQSEINQYQQDNSDEVKRLLEELEKKEFENKVLKEKNEDLEQSIFETKERMIVLKNQNDRVSEELHQIQSQKTELIIELGLHKYDSSYSDIVKRYKQQIKNYQTKLEDLEVYLDTKNSQIEESSSEIELLKQSIGSKKEMEEEKQFKNIEYSKILDRNNEEIQELRKQIEILNEQITAKNQRVMDLSKDNKNYLEEIKEEKKKLLNTEKPLAKLEQFKKLYKKFVLQIKPHIE